ncbi:hypothetical protein HN375_01295 [bacterium]|jgi:hypothetical protein|nr:hypothetical protein [bacterium]MBT3730214.1 hypothetical protein [bacterium]
MNTITLSKTKYLNIQDSQKKLMQKVELMQKMLLELAEDNVRPKYADKLNKISADMDKGKGVKFANARDMEKYLNEI